MRTFSELYDSRTNSLKVKLGLMNPIEKDVVINGLLPKVVEFATKLSALTDKCTGRGPLDFTIISQPDFQITFFGKAEEEPFDNEQYVYIEGYLNHKKVESRRFKVSDINKIDQDQDSTIECVDNIPENSPIQNIE